MCGAAFCDMVKCRGNRGLCAGLFVGSKLKWDRNQPNYVPVVPCISNRFQWLVSVANHFQ